MKYEMRTLNATDIFPMLNIISKIGLRNIKSLVNDGTIETIVATAKADKDSKGANKTKRDALERVGISLFLELGDIVCGNIMKCQDDIFNFLAALCNVDVEEIKTIGMDEFAELIITFLKKDELRDFMRVVSKFLK